MEKDTKRSFDNVASPIQVHSDGSSGDVQVVDHAMKRGLRPRHLCVISHKNGITMLTRHLDK